MTNSTTDTIDNQKHFLETVNKDLQEVVQIALVDFVAVNSLLKKYYLNTRISPEGSPVSAEFIDALMNGLQYMDIFNQRVEHLILIHEKMLTTSMALHFEESFFHLHVFQSMTIEIDLLRSISSIKPILSELKLSLNRDNKEEESIEDYFIHMNGIKTILQKTVAALLEAGGDTQRLPIPTLTSDQIKLLNSMYTMESERIVLEWFLNSMPSGTWEELLQYYEKSINQVDTDNTELF